MTTPYVAVYGTLKKGYSNHDLMVQSGAEHLVTTVTKNKYRMMDGGYPAVYKEDPVCPIHVEVYKMENMALLDMLEGHPDFFHREVVECMVPGIDVHAPSTVPAWMYFGPEGEQGREAVVSDGNWKEDDLWW